MSLASQLELYRARVPAHVGVPDAVVLDQLGQAAEAHTEAAWGAVFDSAMVWWAASQLEPDVVAGLYPIPTADGDQEICAPVGPALDGDGKPLPIPLPSETRYWARYLGLRQSRAATAPRRVSTCG